jgi:alpha-mannosidase
MPVGDQAEYDVPAARVSREPMVRKVQSELRGGMNPDITAEDADAARRSALSGREGELKPLGEVPGGRWVRVRGANGATFGFASDALYNFDAKDGVFRATVCRASRYADDVHTTSDERHWQPAVDNGELRFNFLISPGDEKLPQLAEQLEQPPISILVPPHKGKWKRTGSLASIGPDNIKLLALKPAEDGKGLILRVQETAGKATQPQLKMSGKTVKLSRVEANRIATWRLTGKPGSIKAGETNIAEE